MGKAGGKGRGEGRGERGRGERGKGEREGDSDMKVTALPVPFI